MDKLGRYEILAELGRGAMGTVYRAQDPQIDRIVAIKTINLLAIEPGEMEQYRKRFFREAQAAGKLSHPGIVTIYDVGEEETTDTPYIVMEYIPGQTLADLMSEQSPARPSQETCLELMKQLAEGLDYAHAQSIVHRDIKPSNIIVTAGGRAKITDFGVAKLTHAELTIAGGFVGTPSYVSPEQLKGETIDGRSDLFSLGVILYWMLAGEKPFSGDASTVLAKILYQDPVPVSQCNRALDAPFDLVVNRALAKDPADRYQCGKEFADDLDDLRHGRPLRSRRRALHWPGPRSRPLNPAELVAAEKTVLVGSTAPLPDTAPARGKTALHSTDTVARGKHSGSHVMIAAVIAVIFVGIFAALLLGMRSNRHPVQMVNLIPGYKPATAILRLDCYHSFRSAKISVWVDDALMAEGKLIGEEDRGFQLFKKRGGTHWSRLVSASAGKHTIRVQVTPREGGYAQTKDIEGYFVKDDERVLEITFVRWGRDLHLSWRE